MHYITKLSVIIVINQLWFGWINMLYNFYNVNSVVFNDFNNTSANSMCNHIITMSLNVILASLSIINNKYNRDIRNTTFFLLIYTKTVNYRKHLLISLFITNYNIVSQYWNMNLNKHTVFVKLNKSIN